jgi:hypothetical protein
MSHNHRLHPSRIIAISIVLFIAITSLHAQDSRISGVINLYTPVLAIDGGMNVTVGSTTGLLAGDMVLIIQMRGAVPDLASTIPTQYGTVSYGGAGSFEMAVIERIDGSTVTLTEQLRGTYDPSGGVQLVRVPSYKDVTIEGTVTANAWNGQTEGIVALFASGTVTMNADIDVTGMGFAGGEPVNASDQTPTFWGLGCDPATGLGSPKGDGIALPDRANSGGRGAMANGGGGGNAVNSGGAGGSNGGGGGKGGFKWGESGTEDDIGGIGGYPLLYRDPLDRIFLGGGGGGGSENDRQGTAGGDGGGIVLIVAGHIDGRGHSIVANGTSSTTSGIDGAGGGGGGGTIVVMADGTSGLTVAARGGNGGDVRNTLYSSACHGTGGGAGGGMVWATDTTVLRSLSIDLAAGLPGKQINENSACFESNYGAEAGTPGIELAGLRRIAVNAGADDTICAGETTRLSASGPFPATYIWSPSTGLSCTDCRSPLASPPQTTTYTVRAVDASGDTTIDQVTVTVLPGAKADAGADVAICPGDSATIGGSSSAGIYGWMPVTGLSCASCANPVASPAITTTYTLWVFTPNGCFAADEVTVTVHEPASLGMEHDWKICRGESVTLRVGNAASCSWSPAQGLSCTECTAPEASPASTTLYYVRAIDSNGCRLFDSVLVEVFTPAVGGRADISLCDGTSTTLMASAGARYAWTPSAGLDCDTCRVVAASPHVSTLYMAAVTTDGGCITIDSFMVNVRSSKAINAHIARDYAVKPGVRVTIPVVLDDPLDAQRVDAIEFELRYQPDVLYLEHAMLPGTILDGWNITSERIERDSGIYRARLLAPGGSYLRGTGNLIAFSFLPFIGSVESTELPFTIAISTETCLRLIPRAGSLRIDSVCGLRCRLIERINGSYALDGNRPNPFNPSTTISFSLGLDGPTQLEILNALGEHVTTLIDEWMEPGRYEIVWDASQQPSGLYYCRLRSGVWSRAGTMTLVK